MWPDYREKTPIYPRVYIIDCQKKGNVVRFYLGNDPEYCGNGWGKYPYEDNAEPVRKEYILGYKDISFPFNASVLEPSDRHRGESLYCRNDFKNGIVPCIIVADPIKAGDKWSDGDFDRVLGYKNVEKYYFGDYMVPDVWLDKEKKEA